MKKITSKITFFVICFVLLTISTNCFSITNDTIIGQKKSISALNTAKQKEIPAFTNFSMAAPAESEFTSAFIQKNFPLSAETNDDLGKAMATCAEIDKNSNLTDVLEPKKLSMLPLGIKKTIGGIQYLLGISNAKFTPEYTELTAFVRIILPQIDESGKQKELFFGANNIRLSHKGGLVGDTNLVLLGDVPIKINGENLLLVLKGGMNMATGEIINKTFVTIDCNGFKELGIEADVLFSRNYLEPVDTNYNALPSPQRVQASFKTIIKNWNDILVEISLPAFQLTGYKGTCFELNKAVIDFSDLHNSDAIVWPKDYQKDYLVPGNENLWRGLYVNSLKIVLPSQFKDKESNRRITFQATNLLIDRMGVSGNFSGDNVLDLGKGSASGWQFSVNHIEIGLRANSLTYARFDGDIVLPLSDPSKQCKPGTRSELGYKAIINPVDNEYLLTAEVKSDICFQVFKADAKIEKNSYVELKVKEGVFLPKAVLYGSIAINGSNKPTPDASQTDGTTKDAVAFKGITFQNLQLQTVSPYFKADYFGYKNYAETDPESSKVSNFPITIHEIAIIADDESATLKIDLSVNLMKDQFNGRTKFDIVGKFGKDEGIQKWKFDYLKFEEISLKADIGGAKFNGYIVLMDKDPVYGDGFKGGLKAEFQGGIIVDANAIFGKKDLFRYWYVDAMADGLNIPCSAFVIKGFGGGAYYNMKKDGFSSSFTASGANYVPDIESGLGIKAMIHFANAAKPDAFWGGAGFEIAFLKTGGIRRISIYGEGHMMQNFGFKAGGDSLKSGLKSVVEAEDKMPKEGLDKMKESNLTEAAKQVYPDKVSGQSGLNAYAAIEYDFVAKTLHGTFDLYIDIAGVLKGIEPGNRAGWAVLHFGPDKWYIHMGTPDKRCGLKMGIGPLQVEAKSYFMIGNEMPASPPPLPIVAQILRLSPSSLDYMRSENASKLASGNGFAFGSDFSMKTGDMSFLIFYASFEARLGFDIMVKDYGEAQCKGTGQIGINGWYANGQSYAYLQGKLGIQVKILKKRKKITIIEGDAAVLLQAKLPNPVWISGYLGGHYDVLQGLVKGSFRFKIELGSECEFINSTPLDGLKTIAEINPAEGSKDVNVFTIPQVGFNMPIEKNLIIDDDEGGKKTYRLKLEEYTIKKDGVPIIGTLSWNSTKDLVSFNASDILPQNSQLTLTARISFQENVNGSWVAVTENGQITTETETRNFTTGTAPNNIPESNIAYCYPVFDQKYVYQNESKQAYIVLKQGQPYLFELKPGQSQKAFYKAKNNTTTSAISYDSSNKRVNVELPPLLTSTLYTMSLMTLETKTEANNNLTQNYENKELATDVNIEIKNNKLNETVLGGEGTEILKYNFNTSQYTSFKEKMSAKKPKDTYIEIIDADVHALHAENQTSESFDEIEIIGNSQTLNSPLITVEAVLDDNYYTNFIYPLIYKGYPLETEFNLKRETSILGVPPTKGIELMTWYQDDLINNSNSSYLKSRLPYRYNQPYYYKTDFVDLRYKITNKYLNSQNQTMIQKYNYIMNGIFPMIQDGNYNIRLNYILPGGQAGASSGYIFTFNKSN